MTKTNSLGLSYRAKLNGCILNPTVPSLLVWTTMLSVAFSANGTDQRERATRFRQQLEMHEAKYFETQTALITALDSAIQRIPNDPALSDFSNERAVLKALKALVKSLLQEAVSVERAEDEYHKTTQAYIDELLDAGPKFHGGADLFRKYGADEPYADHKEDYEAAAQVFENLANRCERVSNTLKTELGHVEELHSYLENSHTFLERFDGALETVPDIASGNSYDALSARLKNYVESYQKLRNSLHTLRESLGYSEPSFPSMDAVTKAASGEGRPSEIRLVSYPSTSASSKANEMGLRQQPTMWQTSASSGLAPPKIELPFQPKRPLHRNIVEWFDNTGRAKYFHTSDESIAYGDIFELRIHGQWFKSIQVSGQTEGGDSRVTYWQSVDVPQSTVTNQNVKVVEL